MEHYRLQPLLIRAITALCSLAAVESEDVRSELLDEASWGLQIWMEAPAADRLSNLRAWCDGAAARVGRMVSSHRAFLQAQLALLRLRASLPAPIHTPLLAVKLKPKLSAQPSKLPRSSSQRMLLQTVRSSGPIRSRDLITLLAGKLSDRTVKRTLKDLASAGLVRRVEAAEGVVYEAVVDNS